MNKTITIIKKRCIILFFLALFVGTTYSAVNKQKNVFDKIYERGSWGCKGCSGHGSKYEVNGKNTLLIYRIL